MKIYCGGEVAEVVPVVVARERGGQLHVAKGQAPLGYVCSRCGEPVPARLAVR